jgi:two-component system, chemotaxis family, protein-glutamate methylesterase/glutaminase
MESENIRVFVVDDSAVMRAAICDHVAAAPGMTVSGTARNGRDAIAAIASLHPDVVTLDIQMPEMDGLAVLDAILAEKPVPVIMVSSLTRAGAAITLDALDRGATDYVAKPAAGAGEKTMFAGELIHKIRNAASMDIRRIIAMRRNRPRPRAEAVQPPPVAKPTADACPPDIAERCIAIGISTGGPPALTRVLESLRPPMPPIVIVQHMPPQFTGPLAARLDSISALSVREATQGDRLLPNCVLIAPGGKHLELRGRKGNVMTIVRDGVPVSGHKPSIDVMMTTAAEIFRSNCLGVIMTGMGRDGSNGCHAIRSAGGFVLGQDEASSDVYGMNRAAFVEGNVDQQFGLEEAAAVITRQMKRLNSSAVTS